MGIFDGLTKNTKKTLVNDNKLEKDLSEILVKDVMSKQLIVAQYSTTVYQISKMMEQAQMNQF